MAKFSQRERLQQAITTVRAHPRYSDLAALAGVVYGRRSINPLVVLADCLSENPLSRLLQYLFDSGASHLLGVTFYRAWAQAAALPAAYSDDVHSVRPLPQWQTPSGRYLDLLLEVRDSRGRLRALGLENKLWSSEQAQQLADYQTALAQEYAAARGRLLVFLTPDGRAPTTADPAILQTPCVSVSYGSILDAVEAGVGGGDAQVREFLDQLREYVGSNVVPKEYQMRAARELVAELIQDPATHKAIDLIRAAYGESLTVRNLFYERVIEELRETLPTASLAWHYPPNTPWPPEFNFELQHPPHRALAADGYRLLLMAYCRQPQPRLGDTFTIYVMAFKAGTQKNKQLRNAQRDRWSALVTQLPPAQSPLYDWGPWVCLWAGGKHTIQDLGNGDGSAIAGLLVEAYQATRAILFERA